MLPDSSPADRAPSIPRAPPLAAIKAQPVPVHLELVPVLAHAPALEDHPAPVASADHALAPAEHRRPMRRRALPALLPEAAADARSIPKPKKAR